MANVDRVKAGEAFVEATLETSGFNRDVRTLRNSILGIGRTLTATGAVGIGFGLGLQRAFNPGVRAASDANEVLNRFKNIFGEISGEADGFAVNLAAALNRSKTDVRSNLSLFQGFTQAMGLARGEAFQLSQQLVRTSIDFGSSANIDDLEASRRIMAALAGESEVARRNALGDISAGGLERELGKSVSQATELEKVFARLAIINRTLEGQGVFGDAARTVGDFANVQRGAAAAQRELSESVGRALIPSYTEFLQRLTNVSRVAERFIDAHPEWIQFASRLGVASVAVGGALAGLGTSLLLGGSLMRSGATSAAALGGAVSAVTGPAASAAQSLVGFVTQVARGSVQTAALIARSTVLGAVALGRTVVGGALGATAALSRFTAGVVLSSASIAARLIPAIVRLAALNPAVFLGATVFALGAIAAAATNSTAVLAGVGNTLRQFFGAFAGSIVGIGSVVVETMGAIANDIANGSVRGAFGSLITGVQQAWFVFLQSLVAGFNAVFGASFVADIGEIVKLLGRTFSAVLAAGSTLFVAQLKIAVSVLGTFARLINFVLDSLIAAAGPIKDAFGPVVEAARIAEKFSTRRSDGTLSPLGFLRKAVQPGGLRGEADRLIGERDRRLRERNAAGNPAQSPVANAFSGVRAAVDGAISDITKGFTGPEFQLPEFNAIDIKFPNLPTAPGLPGFPGDGITDFVSKFKTELPGLSGELKDAIFNEVQRPELATNDFDLASFKASIDSLGEGGSNRTSNIFGTFNASLAGRFGGTGSPEVRELKRHEITRRKMLAVQQQSQRLTKESIAALEKQSEKPIDAAEVEKAFGGLKTAVSNAMQNGLKAFACA